MKKLKILKITTLKINRPLSKHFNISKILNDTCLTFNHFNQFTFNLQIEQEQCLSLHLILLELGLSGLPLLVFQPHFC